MLLYDIIYMIWFQRKLRFSGLEISFLAQNFMIGHIITTAPTNSMHRVSSRIIIYIMIDRNNNHDNIIIIIALR